MSRLRPFLHAVYIYYARTRIQINERQKQAELEKSLGAKAPTESAGGGHADGELATGAMTVEDLLRMLVRDCVLVQKHVGRSAYADSGSTRLGSRHHGRWGSSDRSSRSVPAQDFMWTLARAFGNIATSEAGRGSHENTVSGVKGLTIRGAQSSNAAAGDSTSNHTRTGKQHESMQRHLTRGVSMLASGSLSEGASTRMRTPRASLHTAGGSNQPLVHPSAVLRRGAQSSRHVIRATAGNGSESDITDTGDLSSNSDSDSSSVDEDFGPPRASAWDGSHDMLPRRSSRRDMLRSAAGRRMKLQEN